jgi:hypothetical protein
VVTRVSILPRSIGMACAEPVISVTGILERFAASCAMVIRRVAGSSPRIASTREPYRAKFRPEPIPNFEDSPVCLRNDAIAIGPELAIAHGEIDDVGENAVVVETHTVGFFSHALQT